MANVEINDLLAKTSQTDSDELEIQETAGGASKKITRANLLGSAINGTTQSYTIADKAYLDAIEASADVTDATNVAAAGALMTDGSEEMSGDIVFAEAAAQSSTPAAGKGYLWVKSGALSTLVYTDDAGTDFTLGTVYLSNVVEDTTPQLGGQLDVNANAIGDGTRELITFVEDGSAVNNVEIENEATGAGPIIRSTGGDTNVDLDIATKGTGSINLESTTAVTGDITVTGTVDGRDIAADGTALDGTGQLAGAEAVTGLWNFMDSGVGGLTDYDVTVGDVTTPDYGLMRIGQSTFGRTSHSNANLDLDGTVILLNQATPPTSNILFAMMDSVNSIRFALPKSAVGNATYNPRSMMCAGPAPNDDTMVTVGYWQGQGIFDNLVCDTSGSGADLGVQNDLEVEGDIFTDSIKESTTNAGINLAHDIVMPEKADHSITPAAGFGYLWTKSTTPSTVIFTDDAGTDFDLTASGAGISNVVEDLSPQLGGMLDVNAKAIGDGTNELITFVEDASAVNNIEIENEATGAGPILRSTGDDTNVDLDIATKGTGAINLEADTSVTGNITVSGSVDGRDIAADGSTLDGATLDTDTSLAGNGYFLDQDNMSGNDDTKVASQQSIKAYVDGATGAGTDTTAIHDNTAAEISVLTEKASPIGADHILIEDSAASNAKKRIQIGNLPGAATTWIGLTDTDPASYTSQAGKVVAVNAGETGLEFVVAAGGGDLKADGTVPLTTNWDVGAYTITALSFVSDQATGTAPFTVASTTVVTNLNADLLDGNQATAFESADATIVKDADFASDGLLQRSGGAGSYTVDTSTYIEAAGVTYENLDANGDVGTGAAQVSQGTHTHTNPTTCLVIAASDETTALTVADAKVTFRMPYAYTLTDIRASLTTAPVGSSMIADVDLNGTSIMTTNKLEIDATEKSTETAAAAPTLTTTALANDDELTVNINQIGSSTAGAGLKVYLIGRLT